MRDYSYEYEWDLEYCYPHSNVLKNKLNITNSHALEIAEREITSLKLAYAKKIPISRTQRLFIEYLAAMLDITLIFPLLLPTK